jgi:uncharacterized membrane protein
MAAIIYAVLAGLCWGIGELCAKSALKSQEVGPMMAIAIRATVGLPIVWLAWLATAKGWLEPLGVPSARESANVLQASAGTWWKLVVGAGIFAGALGLAFFYLALSSGEISQVKPVAFALAPTFAAAGAFALLGEEITVRRVLGLVLVVIGVVVLTGGGAGSAAQR